MLEYDGAESISALVYSCEDLFVLHSSAYTDSKPLEMHDILSYCTGDVLEIALVTACVVEYSL